MSGKLRWKRDPKETGLRAVGAGPRGYTYWNGDAEFAHVWPLGGNWREQLRGWAWSCPNNREFGIAHHNSCAVPIGTPEEAKAEAQKYIKSCLAKATGE